jgi:hypothetical protein
MAPYCYVPLCLVLKTDATRDPQWAILIRIGDPPGMWGTLVPFTGNRVRWTGGEIPSALTRS